MKWWNEGEIYEGYVKKGEGGVKRLEEGLVRYGVEQLIRDVRLM